MTDGASPCWRECSNGPYCTVSDDVIAVVAEMSPIDLMGLKRYNAFTGSDRGWISSGDSDNGPTTGV